MPPLRVTAIHLWRGFCQAGMPVQEYGAEVCAPIPVAVGVGRSAPSQPSPGWGVRLCRISLEPEAERDRPSASVDSSWGRRERDTLNHLFGIVRWGERRQE